MTDQNSNTKTKKPTAAERRKRKLLVTKSVQAYGQGCGSGHQLALKWLCDRQRTLPDVFSASLQHVMLDLMDNHHKARGAKRNFVRGQVVGFFSMLENPSLAIRLDEWRHEQKQLEGTP